MALHCIYARDIACHGCECMVKIDTVLVFDGGLGKMGQRPK